MPARSGVLAALCAVALFVGGGLVIDGGRVVVGVAVCAAGLVLLLVAFGTGSTAQGRSAREVGFDGFRAEPTGFDRPKDEGRLL